MNRLSSLLLSKLRVSSDEFARGVWLFLLFFLLVNGIFFGRNARDSIFLVKVGLPFLPYAYMLNAVLAIGSAFIYAMFVDRLDRFRLVRMIFIIFIAFLGLTFIGLQTEMRWVIWAAYSIVQVIWLMSLMVFWTFAADFYDTVQSKRLFPLIGMGGLIGMITSGIIAKPLVKAFSTEGLFIAWAALLGVGILIVQKLVQYRAPKPKTHTPKKSKQKSAGQWQQLLEGFQNVRRTPLLLNMVVMLLALWLVFTLIDYQFSQVARQHFTNTETGVTDKNALTTFLGIFRSWAGLLCLAFQLFLTPLVIRKFGVAGAMVAHPGFLLFSIGSMVLGFGFVTASITKFGDHVLLYTFTDVAYQLLYNPIPAAQRGRARAFVEGYIKPFSMGLAGAVLLLLIWLKLSPAQIAACNLAVALVWFFSAFVLKKNYLTAVVSNLQSSPQSSVRAISTLSAENNASLTREMEKRLSSDHPDEVLFAVEYLILIRHEPAAALCPPLLKHPKPAVRQMACRAMSEMGGPAALPLIEQSLADPNTDVVREALAGIRKHGTEDQLPALTKLHAHPDIGIVAETIETEAEVGGFDGILNTAEMLKGWSKSADPRELELLASVLGRLKIKSFLATLLDLGRHPDARVSRAALAGMTHFKDDRVIPPLVDGLRDEILFPKIQHFISTLGEKFRPAIAREYRGVVSEHRHRVRQRLLEAIGQNTKWNSSDLLIEELASDDPVIRFLSLKYLAGRSDAAIPKDRVADVLKNEVGHWIRILAIREQLTGPGSAPSVRPMIDLVFDEEILRTRKAIFLSLGFLVEPKTMRRIYRNIYHGTPAERALALEALENLDIDPWIDLILPLASGAPYSEILAAYLKVFPGAIFETEHIIRNLSTLSYDYLLSAVLFAWKENRDLSRLEAARALTTHPAGIVREHAAAAAAALAP